MTQDALEMELKKGNLTSLYLFYGEERYLLDNMVKRIKKTFGELVQGINYIMLDERNTQSLIADIETPAFGFEKKLIIVKNANLLKKEAKKKKSQSQEVQGKLEEYITNHWKDVKDTVVLVIIEEEADKVPLFTAIEKQGTICQFEKLKPISVKKKLKNICGMYEVGVDESTLDQIVANCGTSMQTLVNEIRKLIEYAGKGGRITKEAVELLTTKQAEAVIFDLTDSLGSKEKEKSMEIYHQLLDAKEPAQRILIMLYQHFRKLWITKVALEEGKDVGSYLGLKPNQQFLLGKYKKQSGYFTREELERIQNELRNLDYKTKIGQMDLNITLESILCTIH